jgi:hypothetical protein
MLTEEERGAIRQWYSEKPVLEKSRELHATGDLERLEEYLHKTCLFPLGRHDSLPAYMLDPEGGPLFPNNLDPRAEEEKWQDAIEIAWEIMEEKLGIYHDEVHRTISSAHDKNWQDFLDSVKRREQERD